MRGRRAAARGGVAAATLRPRFGSAGSLSLEGVRVALTLRHRPRLRPRLVVPLLALGAAVVAMPLVVVGSRPQLAVVGVRDHAALNPAAVHSLVLRVRAPDSPRVDINLDGRPVTALREGADYLVRPGRLAEGRHVLRAHVAGKLPWSSASASRTFTVDSTPPTINIEGSVAAPSLRSPVTIRGSVEPGASLTADGSRVTLAADGSFAFAVDKPSAAVSLVATDAAGNTATRAVPIQIPVPLFRAVHLTAIGWTAPSLREPVLTLAAQGRINAVEVDIKDENGEVGYRSQVPLASAIGAVKGYYDAPQVLAYLHSRHITVIGRIVAFRDPLLAGWGWRHGHPDWVVQAAGGGPYNSRYGSISFTNFAHPQVQQYNLDLAREAAHLGFDHILYDYIRRPDGPRDSMRFPGLRTDPAVAIADFVKATRGPVREAGAYLGVSVFGVAATRPDEVAQNIPLMARGADYVAPMLYPSHWAHGEYGVSDPNAQPFAIVDHSLADFTRNVQGTGAVVAPWLQDFSLGVTYGPPQVRAQIDAAAHNHIHNFLLWNAGSRYQGSALDQIR